MYRQHCCAAARLCLKSTITIIIFTNTSIYKSIHCQFGAINYSQETTLSSWGSLSYRLHSPSLGKYKTFNNNMTTKSATHTGRQHRELKYQTTTLKMTPCQIKTDKQINQIEGVKC